MKRGSIKQLVNQFSEAMRARLYYKGRVDQFSGWDTARFSERELIDRLLSQVVRAQKEPHRWIDVANFAAFLWWRSGGQSGG